MLKKLETREDIMWNFHFKLIFNDVTVFLKYLQGSIYILIFCTVSTIHTLNLHYL